MQEVHTNKKRSQTKLIAEALGYPYTFETVASDSHIDLDYKLANAVISKQPFKETKAVRLPRPAFLLELPLLPNGQRAEIHDKFNKLRPEAEPRGIKWNLANLAERLFAMMPHCFEAEPRGMRPLEIQVMKFEKFMLANVHTLPLHVLGTSYNSDEGRTFAKEVEKIMLEYLSTPLVFCGDFNYNDIQNLYPNLFNKLNLFDALPDEPSVPNADVRIDYILISKNDFQIVDSFIHPLMTDHFPCWLGLISKPQMNS